MAICSSVGRSSVLHLSGFEVRTAQSHMRSHTGTLCTWSGMRAVFCFFKNLLALDSKLRKITENMSGYLRSIGTVCCFNLATVLQANLTGLLVSSHFQIRCQSDFTYSSFKVTVEDERPQLEIWIWFPY